MPEPTLNIWKFRETYDIVGAINIATIWLQFSESAVSVQNILLKLTIFMLLMDVLWFLLHPCRQLCHCKNNMCSNVVIEKVSLLALFPFGVTIFCGSSFECISVIKRLKYTHTISETNKTIFMSALLVFKVLCVQVWLICNDATFKYSTQQLDRNFFRKL